MPSSLHLQTIVPTLDTWGAAELDEAVKRGTIFCYPGPYGLLHARLIGYSFEDYCGLFELVRDEDAPQLSLNAWAVRELFQVRHVVGLWPSYLNTRTRVPRSSVYRSRRLYPASG